MDKFFDNLFHPKKKSSKLQVPPIQVTNSNSASTIVNTGNSNVSTSNQSQAAPSLTVTKSTTIPHEYPQPLLDPTISTPNYPPSPLENIVNYQFLQTLGKGTYGTVKLALHIPTNRHYAIKIIRKDILMKKNKLGMVEKEVTVVGRVRHLNVISCLEWFEASDKYYVVFELATGGELLGRIANMNSFTESQACHIAATLLNALAFLHDHGVVHRDIKPENILYKDDRPNSPLVLVDFGIARVLEEPEDSMDPKLLKTICGSLAYTAPEVLLRKGYSYPVDVWGVGVLLFVLVAGRHPFFDRDEDIGVSQVVQRICKGAIVSIPGGKIVIPAHLAPLLSPNPPAPFNSLSGEFMLLMLKLLSLPDTRPNAHEALNDAWIRKWCRPEWLDWLMEVNEWSEFDGISRAKLRQQLEANQLHQVIEDVQMTEVEKYPLDHDSLPLSEPDLEFKYPENNPVSPVYSNGRLTISTRNDPKSPVREEAGEMIATLLRKPSSPGTAMPRTPGDTLNPVGTLKRKTKGRSGNLMETMIRMKNPTAPMPERMDLDGMSVDVLAMGGDEGGQVNLLA